VSVLPIRRDTLAIAVADRLRERLLSGETRPGSRLDAAALAEQTGVPAPTLRTALGELERDGLLVHSLQRGLEVARLTPADVRDIYLARRAFERAGLEALLGRRPIDVAWLDAAVERMSEAAVSGSGRAAVEADCAFHLALVAAAGSRHLTAAAQCALRDLRLVLSVADRVGDDLPALAADHHALVEVFRSGRRRTAFAALEHHLAHGEGLARAVCEAALSSA
jgi:DNA-binding GntR family transcriptional regulator